MPYTKEQMEQILKIHKNAMKHSEGDDGYYPFLTGYYGEMVLQILGKCTDEVREQFMGQLLHCTEAALEKKQK